MNTNVALFPLQSQIGDKFFMRARNGGRAPREEKEFVETTGDPKVQAATRGSPAKGELHVVAFS